MKRYNDFYIVIVGRVLSIIVSLLSFRLITTQLGVEEVGFYYILQTVITLLNFAVFSSISQYYYRTIYQENELGLLSITSKKVLAIRCILMLITIIPIVIVYYFFNYSEYSTFSSFYLIILISILGSNSLTFLEAINILEDRLFYTLVSLAQLVFGVFLAYYFTLYFSNSAKLWIFGVALSQCLLFPVVWVRLLKKAKNNDNIGPRTSCFSLQNSKNLLRFLIPISFILLLQWGQNTSYRLMLGEFYSIVIVAHVAMGVAISSSVFMAVETISGQYLLPKYYKSINGKSRMGRGLAWDRYADIVLPVYMVTLFFVTFLSKELLVLLVDQKFHSGWLFVIIGGGVEFFRTSSNIIYMVTTSEIRSSSAVMPYLIGFILMIALLNISHLNSSPINSMLLILSSYFVTCVFLFVKSRKMLDINFPCSSIVHAMLLSTVFCFSFLWDVEGSFISALIKLTLFGLIYLVLIYLLTRRKLGYFLT